MTQLERIDRFERLGLGLFVHFGVFSVTEGGEWYKAASEESDAEYDRHIEDFFPKRSWAEDIAEFALKNGFRYVVLTTRHHDGFSLYDTRGLSDFDAMHLKEPRDLVREFVEACRSHGLIPYFYHTLIDWREEKNYDSFHDYLGYLRNSVRLLCTEYGEIGGFWFDGQWKYKNRDWELDALYGMIRRYQPNAMIINNSGLNNLGVKTHREIDAVTFERANIQSFDRGKANGLYSAEMCQSMNGHWGYARNDISYKSLEELLENLCICRARRGNYLLNIGPKPDGTIREIDRALIDLLGQWVRLNAEALYDTVPYADNIPEGVFAMKQDSNLYVFFMHVPMEIDPNAGVFSENKAKFRFPASVSIQSAVWLDNGEIIQPQQDENGCFIQPAPFHYGSSFIVRVAKCAITEQGCGE